LVLERSIEKIDEWLAGAEKVKKTPVKSV
jgi:hypothetical protein